MPAPRTLRPAPVPTTEATLQSSLEPHPEISHVVFDFDGTLSWIRHGWPAIMHAVFDRNWVGNPEETPACRKKIFDSIIIGLNGRPTIHQMERFADLLSERNITRDPESLRLEYQEELDQEIYRRLASIHLQQSTRDEFVVHGARSLLEWLANEGLNLIVLSSTIEYRVREEAEALGLTDFFKNRIHGSGENSSAFSKMDVLQRILEEDGIQGNNLLSFGDGPVEIECTKKIGGTAIAICSDETENGSGRMEPVKHSQLLKAGADAALPDFRDATALMQYLLQR